MAPKPAGRRFHLRTFGCQMNQHDAEKMANVLFHEGYRPGNGAADADLVLIHTCSVRDKAEQKLYSELGALAPLKRDRPELLLGVGGCVAQQEGARILQRFPQVDFVFGPQNLARLARMVRDARSGERTLAVEEAEAEARFELPQAHPEYASQTPGRAFVTVMEGCDLFCTFCVVPTTRGRELSRPADDIVQEVEAAAARGAVEITLLGQTVNAYGRPRPGRAPGEVSFADLIRRVAAVDGIARVRFTSPHPFFMTPELCALYGELDALCPHLHLPAQSGSSAVLAAMNRRYDRDDYLELVATLRAARPDLAITTDLIVGFPGETDADFEQTLTLVEAVGFTDSFSFKYSPRPGTPAVRRGLEPIEAEVAQARLVELQAVQGRLTLAAHRARVGTRTRVLVEGESRRGGQAAGRCPYNRVVNFAPSGPEVRGPIQTAAGTGAGRFADVWIRTATPHSLLAEEEGVGGLPAVDVGEELAVL